MPRQRRVDAPHRRERRRVRLVRDRRRASADRHGLRPRGALHGQRRRLALLLRRRHHEHRRVPRGDEPRGDLEAADDLRLREQPLRRVLPAGEHDARSTSWCAAPTGTRCPASASTATTCWRSARSSARPSSARAAGEGPTFVEALTYRHKGHSRTDPGTYRPQEEVDAWLARDPIPAFERALQDAGVPAARRRGDARRGDRRGRRAPRARARPGPTRRSPPASTTSTHDRRSPTARRSGSAWPTRSPPTTSVFLIGEDIAAAGGAFKITDGLMDRFGAERVLDTPISEQAIIGAAIGASIRGLRPVAELMFADFAGVCFDQIANQLAKYRYMTGGQVTRAGDGAARERGRRRLRRAALAERRELVPQRPGPQDRRAGHPGRRLRADARGGARRRSGPAVRAQGAVQRQGRGRHRRRAGRARPRRRSRAPAPTPPSSPRSSCARGARGGGEALAGEGISVEVVDPRTLVPLDMETIAASLAQTNRLVVAQECPPDGSWGASIVARVIAESFDLLDGPPALVSADATPVPYAGAARARVDPGRGADRRCAVRESLAS